MLAGTAVLSHSVILQEILTSHYLVVEQRGAPGHVVGSCHGWAGAPQVGRSTTSVVIVGPHG